MDCPASFVHASAVPSTRAAKDRRVFRRAALDVPVLLETSSATRTVRSVDVSGGGIAIRTELALEVGSRVSIYFELPFGYQVEVNAEVVRQEGDRAALRFVDAPYDTVLAIRSFCRISGVWQQQRSPASSPRP